MILFASSCSIVIITILITTAQAIYTAPVTGNLHDLMSYDVNYGRDTSDSRTSNIQTTEHISPEDTRPPQEEEQTVYVIEFESEPSENNSDKGRKGNDSESNMSDISPLDPWSIVWYIGSFGGLVAFFLFVSCSEWCCRRGARSSNTPYSHRTGEVAANTSRGVSETPPPPYHLFAPPPYDSIHYGQVVDKTGEKKDIYVISVPVQDTTQPAPA